MKKILGLLLAALLVTSLAAGLADEPAVQETLAERVLRLVPDAGELVRMDGDDLYDLVGVDPEGCLDWVYLAAADALEGRELIVLRMPDEAAADEAETMLNLYLTARLRETRNYLPDAYEELSRAEVVRQNCLLILSVAAPQPGEAEALLAEE